MIGMSATDFLLIQIFLAFAFIGWMWWSNRL